MSTIRQTQTNQIIKIGLILLIALILFMLKSSLVSIIFSLILTGTSLPLFNYFLKKGVSRGLSALVVCLIIFFICLIPLTYLITDLTYEVIDIYNQLLKGQGPLHEIKDLFFGDGLVAYNLKKIFLKIKVPYSYELFEKSLLHYLKNTGLDLANYVNHLLANLIVFSFDFLLMILMVFTLLTEGESLRSFVFKNLRIPHEQETLIVGKLNQMNFVLLMGNGLCGIMEAVGCGIVFALCGVESVIFWSTLMIFLAFIPIMGVAIAYIPVALYLFLKDQILEGTILLVLCTMIFLLVENVFKPKFIGHRIKMNSWVVFWSILGGVGAFGIGGIFYGPLVAVLFMTLCEIYTKPL